MPVSAAPFESTLAMLQSICPSASALACKLTGPSPTCHPPITDDACRHGLPLPEPLRKICRECPCAAGTDPVDHHAMTLPEGRPPERPGLHGRPASSRDVLGHAVWASAAYNLTHNWRACPRGPGQSLSACPLLLWSDFRYRACRGCRRLCSRHRQRMTAQGPGLRVPGPCCALMRSRPVQRPTAVGVTPVPRAGQEASRAGTGGGGQVWRACSMLGWQ